MKFTIPVFLLAGALAASLPSHAQETAGRVILAVGDVTIVRGTEKIPATVGASLRSGDTLELGARAHAQIYMTDESIISLRPETTFRIRDYAYQDREPAAQRAFFDLVKGGMRTVAGRINRRGRYGVDTANTTLGIRGTHYWLVSCDRNCRNRDGSLAPDGDYGLVRDGRVGVTPVQKQAGNESREKMVFASSSPIMGVASPPQAGEERQFGSDQAFFSSPTGAVNELIGPPAFLFPDIRIAALPTTPDGKPAPKEKPAAPRLESAPALAPSGERGGAPDLRVTSAGTDNTNLTSSTFKRQADSIVQTQTGIPLANDAFSVAGPAAVLQPTNTGTVFYRLTGPFNLPLSGSNNVLVNGDITLGVNLTLQLAYIRVNVVGDGGGIANVGNPAATAFPITVSGGTVSFSGSFNLADFPNNTFAFRCSRCGPGDTPGFFTSIGASGTINGSNATVTFSATDAGGPESFTATLSRQTPPNNIAGSMSIRNFDGSRDNLGAAYWDVDVDASGRALRMNQGGTVPGGARNASVGTAINTIVGTAPAAGNLVWGTWSAGAQMTDSDYVTFTSTAVQPWITGTITNTLPASLGSSVTYTPVGSLVLNNDSGLGTLNSALLTANFVNRSVNVSVNATSTSSARTFQMNGSTNISAVNGRFAAGFTSVGCSIGGVACSGTTGGSYSGFFAGPNAEGAAMAFHTGASSTGVNGVIGLKR